MNFNYLMSSSIIKRRCKTGDKECYWVPAGNIRSTQGDNVFMTMLCKKCGAREDIFLSREQYHKQEKLIQKELGNV